MNKYEKWKRARLIAARAKLVKPIWAVITEAERVETSEFDSTTQFLRETGVTCAHT